LKAAGDPSVLYVKYNQAVDLELWQGTLTKAAAGYQAFLRFDTSLLNFVSGAYTPDPYGQHTITPIVAVGGNIDLAGNCLFPQIPWQPDAKLADLGLTSGTSEGVTEVIFRVSDPPSRLADNDGN
jgi:hypothetical protein